MTDNLGFYEAFATEYRDFYDLPAAEEAVASWCAALREADLWPNGPVSLLDLGCGPATHLASWAREVGHADGLDGSPAMLAAARRCLTDTSLGYVGLYCADATEPDTFASLRGKYDIVAAHFNFLNLFDDDELARVTESIDMLLKSGGLFICDMLIWEGGLDHLGAKVFEEKYQGPRWRSHQVRFDPSKRTISREWTRDGAVYCETLHLHAATELKSLFRHVGLEPRLLEEIPHSTVIDKGGALELDRRLAVFAKRGLT